jgi:hypothetical protein
MQAEAECLLLAGSQRAGDWGLDAGHWDKGV